MAKTNLVPVSCPGVKRIFNGCLDLFATFLIGYMALLRNVQNPSVSFRLNYLRSFFYDAVKPIISQA